MQLLLDSHALLWLSTDDPRLSKRARELALDPDHGSFLSSASVWELAIKKSLGRLELTVTLGSYLDQQRGDLGFTYLPVRPAEALRVEELPFHHRDPFDRLLIAQAQVNDLALLSADSQLAEYDVEVIW